MNNKNSFLSILPPVTLNLLIINFLFWLASAALATGALGDIREVLGLYYWQSSRFHVYQFVTYMFQHADFSHIFFNMFGLFMFGPVLEHVWGSRRYLFFFLFTGIGAGIVQEAVWTVQIGNSLNDILLAGGFEPITIGASGAIFGILLAFAMTFPDARMMLIFLPIPVKAKYFVPIYALIELFSGIYNPLGDNVAHFAHLGGALFGVILILYWKKHPFSHN